MSRNRALILGITGQDGSYLADILLEKGYEVHGLYRRSATGNLRNIEHILDKVTLHQGDLADSASVYRVIYHVKPDEVYNEADQDNVDWSYSTPDYSYDITGAAVGRILESILRIDRNIRFFQPVSATMFGSAPAPQDESTPFSPQSPYACAKVMAYYVTRYYRKTHGLFASTAIMYNHDSSRRSEECLLQRICRAAIKISDGRQGTLSMGGWAISVDIGYAREYMQAAWDIMQLDTPDDFVLATGQGCTISGWIRYAFEHVGVQQGGRVTPDYKPSRPGKTPTLIGDATKARETFGFDPQCKGAHLVNLLIDGLKERGI